MHKKIIFIGPMGAGKTSLGKRLSSYLRWTFVDTDYVICERCGTDIPTIFKTEGEIGFRQREHEALVDVLARSGDAVISCGGGIILSPENRRLLCAQFMVVFLDISVEEQINRIAHDKNRPLSQGNNLFEKLTKMREERLALYEGLADITLETDSNRFNFIFSNLVAQVEQWINEK